MILRGFCEDGFDLFIQHLLPKLRECLRDTASKSEPEVFDIDEADYIAHDVAPQASTGRNNENIVDACDNIGQPISWWDVTLI